MSPEVPTTAEASQQLWSILKNTQGEEQIHWLQDAVKTLQTDETPIDNLMLFSAQTARQLGRKPLQGGTSVLDTPHGQLPVAHWEAHAAGRILLVLSTICRDPSLADKIVRSLYRQGDEKERESVIQGLSLFSIEMDPKELAKEAGRTNSPPLFSALALRNPFPAARYEEHEFNQMVLKVLFMGLPAALIMNLEERANAELSRMCEDYLDERLAANRSVPADAWLALAPHASNHGEALMLDFLGAPDTAHRYYAAIAAGRRMRTHPELQEHLAARLAKEDDQQIRSLLTSILSA